MLISILRPSLLQIGKKNRSHADHLPPCVAGVDFGTLKTVIAVARNRGVDVVCECHGPTTIVGTHQSWTIADRKP